VRRNETAGAGRGRGRSTPASHDRWLLSYADFMTLLFAFFTTLYAASSVDAEKLSSVAAGLHDAFDRSSAATHPAGRGLPVDGSTMTSVSRAEPAAAIDPPARSTRAILEAALVDDLAAHRLALAEDRRGIVLSIPEAGSFPSGSAELSDAAGAVMTRLSSALHALPNAARIEGHTDDTPIHTPRFSSNWELSTARATHVVAFLIQQGAIAPDRLSAAGYGAFHPVSDNASPAGRARNRRVDVIVLNDATRSAEEPLPQGAGR
jgi:chemotaxis protein MotB